MEPPLRIPYGKKIEQQPCEEKSHKDHVSGKVMTDLIFRKKGSPSGHGGGRGEGHRGQRNHGGKPLQ